MGTQKIDATEIEVNGVKYVPKGSEERGQRSVLDDYCIVRTYSAGVFAGNLVSRKGKEGVMKNSRGIYYWAGAGALSQLAVDGTSNPGECKFTVETPVRELTEIIEVIPCTEKAFNSIRGVKEWRE